MWLLLSIILLVSNAVIADNNLLGLPAVKIPTDNPQTPEKIALGKALFNDKRLSADGTVGCRHCHQPDQAFTDGLPVAIGINGKQGVRNSPTLMNVAYLQTLFVDGRADSLEQQALGPLLNPVEHGLKDQHQLLELILRDDHYRQQLQQIFSITVEQIDVSHIAKAIASYERTLIAGNTAFDRYFFGRERSQLSASAARGLRLFRRKGNCANCHEISWNQALFTDNRFYNIGVGIQLVQSQLDDFIQFVNQGNHSEDFSLTAEQRSALGRFNITHFVADIGKFKTPTLRNIARTAPYMHDGSLATLEEVVDYYNKGGHKNRFLDPAIFPLHLSQQEQHDLVEFMKTLSSF